jgi:N-terminal domain of toast_rack, DUF2154
MMVIAGPVCAMLMMVTCGGVTLERAGPLRNESQSVELQGAKSAVVNIMMGAGRLRASGGAQRLLDATFIYNIPSWKPIVEYGVNGTQGNLTIRQPKARGAQNARNEWDLRFANEVPIDLRMDVGAGTADLNLRGLDLKTFDFHAGAGKALVDLTGQWRRDVNATIGAGVGELTLRLPRTIGVRVEVERAVSAIDADGFKRDGGAYVNDAFGSSATTMHIAMSAGVGAIHLQLE